MADILIKGLALPIQEECGQELLCLTIYADGTVVTPDGVKATAIEIPPHGRLTDALHLYMDIKNYFCDSDICVAKKNGIECVHCHIETVLDNIERRTTIVEASNA